MFPVTCSDKPLVFDTLPAVKTCWFHHEDSLPARDAARIYTLARPYYLGGELQLGLTAFEREPGADSRVAFALAGETGLLLAVLSPGQLWLSTHADAEGSLWDAPVDDAPHPPPEYYAGVDEQGWYWGARCCLPAAALRAVGVSAQDGAPFGAALLKYRRDIRAYGASFTPEDPEHPLRPGGFGRFAAVGY